ncbi:antiterminator LoaP [Paenibacillus pinihumi]|uniref:antiterminator LoaP n=1 Tax=Paenibacillus pinihumi TaxID=669462 RepID=UPI0003F674D0|nr:antiterminator LoaP [Paenibacillus pinihumi]
MKWYALHVETGKEDFVRSEIRKQFDPSTILSIVPKRKLIERKQGVIYEKCRTLFPGYVFIKARMNVKTYHDLKKIPRYYKLLNNFRYDDCDPIRYDDTTHETEDPQTELFSQIDEKEMALIIQLIDHDEIISYSSIYVENAKVKVYKGPLKGKEAMIKKIDKRKKRARIVLDFLGKQTGIDVGIEVLSPYVCD